MLGRVLGRVDGERLGSFDGKRLGRMLERTLYRVEGNILGRLLGSVASVARRRLFPAPLSMAVDLVFGFSTTAWPVSLSLAGRILLLRTSSGCRT